MKEVGFFICGAIKNFKLIEFDYNGLNRVMQPWIMGEGVTGKIQLLGYQLYGESASGIMGWKLMDLDKIEKFKVLGVVFVPKDSAARETYNPKDKRISRPVCQIRK